MRIDFLTLFPEMCQTVMGESIIGRAQGKGLIEVVCHQIRDYAADKHRQVDGYTFGGGMGMLMRAEPISACFEAVCQQSALRPHLIYLSPQGKVFTQQRAKELSELPHIAFLCGHYEGVDERVLEEYVDEEISIGDYVLTGGELPALIVADAVARLVPGVLSEEECFTEESHYDGLLEYPQYTRPAVWHERIVPEILLSGHHAKIQKWRRAQSVRRTALKRPDLLRHAPLTREDKFTLYKLREECLNKENPSAEDEK